MENSIKSIEYIKDDVNKKKRLFKEEAIVLGDEWQEEHLMSLADFICKMLDTADNVPDFLREESQFKPEDLLSKH